MKTKYQLRARAAHEDQPFDTSVLPSGWAETILLLVENQKPVDDGNFPSKLARDMLIKHGFAQYVVLQGKQAGCVATYKGGYLYCQLLDMPNLREAIEYRRARPNFLNELWNEQRAVPA